jgi:hypothetical protein
MVAMTTLYRITSPRPRFAACIVVSDSHVVVQATGELEYMAGWRRGDVMTECRRRGWGVAIVQDNELSSAKAAPVGKGGES